MTGGRALCFPLIVSQICNRWRRIPGAGLFSDLRRPDTPPQAAWIPHPQKGFSTESLQDPHSPPPHFSKHLRGEGIPFYPSCEALIFIIFTFKTELWVLSSKLHRVLPDASRPSRSQFPSESSPGAVCPQPGPHSSGMSSARALPHTLSSSSSSSPSPLNSLPRTLSLPPLPCTLSAPGHMVLPDQSAGSSREKSHFMANRLIP